jgi:hypothetical protein
MPAPDFRDLLTPELIGWRMAGRGGFRWVPPGVLESQGGPGLFWYANETFDDFVLDVVWRATRPDDNSGIFLRCPPLHDGLEAAVAQGYEVQIDDRGFDPETGRSGSPLHLTGAIYRLAPAVAGLSAPPGAWNRFVITARGRRLDVVLNGEAAAHLEGGDRAPSGHLALQCHHDGAAVQFRHVAIKPLSAHDATPARG